MRLVLPLAILAAAVAMLMLTPADATIAGLDHREVAAGAGLVALLAYYLANARRSDVAREVSSLAVWAENPSVWVRKILVRNDCSTVRQVSPGSASCSELMLCVATMGMQRGSRERARNFSSPLGSFCPAVANSWYSSQMKNTCRQ